jgi:hypothetical protein
MFDCQLAFGTSASPTTFRRLSQAIKRMMACRAFHKIVAFQDDFLLVGDSYHECLRGYTELEELIQSLGFVLNEKILVCPTTKLVFLGIQIDTIVFTK